MDFGYLLPEEMNCYSVLMSVYKSDKAEYLKQAIDSMLSQTFVPEQFVIVEDGPISDDLEQIIVENEEKEPNLFTIVRLKENGGLGNALNQGLKVCRNELVARMDSDDISKPDRCAKQIAEFRREPQIGILGTQIDEFIDNTTNIVSKRIVPTHNEEIKKFAKRRSPFNHPTVMYRKSVIEKLGGYTACGRKEDLELFVRSINSGVIGANLNESLLYYRTNDENLKRRKTWINCKEYIQIMYKFYKLGYLGFTDFCFVFFGQLFMFTMPTQFVKMVSDKYLRKRNENK